MFREFDLTNKLHRSQTYRGDGRRLGSDFGADSCGEQREGNGGAHLVFVSGYGKGDLLPDTTLVYEVILGRLVNS